MRDVSCVHILVFILTCGNTVQTPCSTTVHWFLLTESAPEAFLRTNMVPRTRPHLCDWKDPLTRVLVRFVFKRDVCCFNGDTHGSGARAARVGPCVNLCPPWRRCACGVTSRSTVRSKDNGIRRGGGGGGGLLTSPHEFTVH